MEVDSVTLGRCRGYWKSNGRRSEKRLERKRSCRVLKNCCRIRLQNLMTTTIILWRCSWGLKSPPAARYWVNLLRSGNTQCSECYVMEENQCCKLDREPSGTGHKIISRYCRRTSVSLALVLENRQSTLRLITLRCVHRILFWSVRQGLYTNMIVVYSTGMVNRALSVLFALSIFSARCLIRKNVMSLTECNSGTIQKLLIWSYTTIELQNTVTSDIVIKRGMFQLTSVPVLLDVDVIYCSWIEWQFLGCSAVALSERCQRRPCFSVQLTAYFRTSTSWRIVVKFGVNVVPLESTPKQYISVSDIW
jgi:hypothetical protein